jgi:GT2 family glycosyltransferase
METDSTQTEMKFLPLNVDDKLTIGISAYGNAATSRRCIEAVLKSLRGNFELLLVDDCSPDNGETLSLFLETKDLHPNTKVFSFESNQEYSGSLNAILSHAQGGQICFLSNDIIASPSYFKLILEAEEANGPGIFRGSSNFVDNGMESHNIKADQEINCLDDVASYAQSIASIYGPMAFEDMYLTGDAFLVSRPVLTKIGTFDPLFYGYFADSDFGIRCRNAGYSLFLVPGAWAYHDSGSNFAYLPQVLRQEKLRRRWARVHENWARFKLKYGLPVSLPYININDIPWETLSTMGYNPERDYQKPGDYSGALR